MVAGSSLNFHRASALLVQGGAAARPFLTSSRALGGGSLSLRIAPELYLKVGCPAHSRPSCQFKWFVSGVILVRLSFHGRFYTYIFLPSGLFWIVARCSNV